MKKPMHKSQRQYWHPVLFYGLLEVWSLCFAFLHGFWLRTPPLPPLPYRNQHVSPSRRSEKLLDLSLAALKLAKKKSL